MSKEDIKELIDKFKELDTQCFVKLTFSREWRPDEDKTVFAIFHKEDEFNNLLWGHPLGINDDEMICGEMGCFITDIKDIQPVTPLDFIHWNEKYQQFHKSVTEEKGQDVCTEIFHNISLFTKDEK